MMLQNRNIDPFSCKRLVFQNQFKTPNLLFLYVTTLLFVQYTNINQTSLSMV